MISVWKVDNNYYAYFAVGNWKKWKEYNILCIKTFKKDRNTYVLCLPMPGRNVENIMTDHNNDYKILLLKLKISRVCFCIICFSELLFKINQWTA